jgi:hypothetical protein
MFVKIIRMSFVRFPRWMGQSLAGIAFAVSLSLAFSPSSPSAQQSGPSSPGDQSQAPSPAANGEACSPGFTGSPQTSCADVNECRFANGGCHAKAQCLNTPGSRECGECPEGYQGNGYIGCFDVNECPNFDCTSKIPQDDGSGPPPVVTTSGDVSVTATSEAGAPAKFTATAKDPKDGTRTTICLPASGTTFPVGKTTVTCWATNTRGYLGQATLTVTVTRAAF